MAKILRKRMKRLETRRHSRDLTVQNLEKHGTKNIDWEKAFRKPGSMKK